MEPGAVQFCQTGDGRKLGFQEFGCPDGIPVVYCHGWPACRLEAFLYETGAREAAVRLIAVDRPGMGQSDLHPDLALLNWPDDVQHLADHLGLERFHLLGHSGGGPFAAACAFRIPQRLKKVAIVAGLAPMDKRETRKGMKVMNRFLLRVGRPFPILLRLMMGMTKKMASDPEALKKSLQHSPEVDRVLMQRHLPEIKLALSEAFSGGVEGATREGEIYASPWGFSLSEVKLPVTYWQGSFDTNVPLSNGKIYQREIAACELRVIEAEGHFSLPLKYAGQILKELVQDD